MCLLTVIAELIERYGITASTHLHSKTQSPNLSQQKKGLAVELGPL